MRSREPDLFELQRRAALGTMCAGIAHEVNAPLGCAADLLRQALERSRGADRGGDGLLTEQLDQALRSVTLAAGVLRDALNLARPSELDGTTDLTRDVETVIGLSASGRPRNVTLEADLCPGVRVQGTSTHVQQIALNLLMNAFRALSDAGPDRRVRVTTRSTGLGSALLVVSDDGPGIPPEIRSRLFQPFVASRVCGEGTGLGLHVVKRIAEMLGGSVEIRSERDRGTSVSVELPRAC